MAMNKSFSQFKAKYVEAYLKFLSDYAIGSLRDGFPLRLLNEDHGVIAQ